MSKVIGTPLDDEPSSPPSGVVDPSTSSPTNSASVNPLFTPESAVLEVNPGRDLLVNRSNTRAALPGRKSG
jgi:hypothetical protein